MKKAVLLMAVTFFLSLFAGMSLSAEDKDEDPGKGNYSSSCKAGCEQSGKKERCAKRCECRTECYKNSGLVDEKGELRKCKKGDNKCHKAKKQCKNECKKKYK